MIPEPAIEVLFEYLTSCAGVAPAERAILLQQLHEQPGLQDVIRIISALPFALDLQQAPTELKTRVLATIASEEMITPAREHTSAIAGTPLYSPGELIIRRKNEGEWVNPGIPGVSVKTLFADHTTGYLTMLVRMEPDTTYPVHHHAGYEECFMLEGEVSSGELQLFAGDYQRLAGGTTHQALYTKAGCLFLVVASEHNELI